MGAKSTIEWTDASWSPIRARNIKTGKVGWYCEHSTTGCEFCYAESMNKRLGTGLPFKPGHRKDVELFLDETMLLAPLRWKKPRMIFVCSMTDLFADFVPDEWIDKVFAVMASSPQHTFQVLTKRAERMRDYVGGNDATKVWRVAYTIAGGDPEKTVITWPLPNVWLGVSAERQQEADERIPHLLQTPAAVRFVSAEPLLGPIDFTRIVYSRRYGSALLNSLRGETRTCHDEILNKDEPKLNWIIVGGESGSNARPFHVEWADKIIAQTHDACVQCFVKQLGSCPISDGYPLELKSRKGGDPDEWPMRLAVREMPRSNLAAKPLLNLGNQVGLSQ